VSLPKTTYTSPHSDDWTGAACHGWDPDIWFPEPSDILTTRTAKRICARCPLSDTCLLEHMYEDYGIFAGLDGHERRELRRGKRSSQPAHKVA
jgi:WhiB family transcriptional regulator, redox-sensing transcriptional regulator